MKTILPQYFSPNEQEFKEMWKKAIIVFDASVLLALYEVPKDVSNQLLAILEIIRDRLWIPHQVALEFLDNRPIVKIKQKNAYNQTIAVLEKAKEKFIDSYGQFKIKHYFFDTDLIKQRILGKINHEVGILNKYKLNHILWEVDDLILTKINNIFSDNKLGKQYSEKQYQDIYKEADVRYQKGIPPGYMDVDKDPGDRTKLKKYGDYIIWKQLIDKGRKDKKPIIFITDDDKEDWWKVASEQIICPREELIKEMLDKAGVGFYMYQSERFMEYAKQYLGLTINEKIIKEIKQVKEISRKNNEAVVASTNLSKSNITSQRNSSNEGGINASQITKNLAYKVIGEEAGKKLPRKRLRKKEGRK